MIVVDEGPQVRHRTVSCFIDVANRGTTFEPPICDVLHLTHTQCVAGTERR